MQKQQSFRIFVKSTKKSVEEGLENIDEANKAYAPKAWRPVTLSASIQKLVDYHELTVFYVQTDHSCQVDFHD